MLFYVEKSNANHAFDPILYKNVKTKYCNLSTDLHLLHLPKAFIDPIQLRVVRIIFLMQKTEKLYMVMLILCRIVLKNMYP